MAPLDAAFQLEPSERPGARCLRKGARCLSLRELLAILIGSACGESSLELAQKILELPGSGLKESEKQRALFTGLESSSGSALFQNVVGFPPTAQARVLASFELARRYACYRDPPREPALRTSFLLKAAIRQIGPELRHEPREWLGFVPFHRSGSMGEFCQVELGVRTHVNVEPAELFARVLGIKLLGHAVITVSGEGWIDMLR
jgi:DNA repair protein RadC